MMDVSSLAPLTFGSLPSAWDAGLLVCLTGMIHACDGVRKSSRSVMV